MIFMKTKDSRGKVPLQPKITPPEFRDWPGVKKAFRLDIPSHDPGLTILGKTPREKAEEIYNNVKNNFQQGKLTPQSISSLAVLANILGKNSDFIEITEMQEIKGLESFLHGQILSLLDGSRDKNSVRKFIRNFPFDSLVPLDGRENVEKAFVGCIGAWMLGEFNTLKTIRALARRDSWANPIDSAVLNGLLAFVYSDEKEVGERVSELEIQLDPSISPQGGKPPRSYSNEIMIGIFLALVGGASPKISSKSK